MKIRNTFKKYAVAIAVSSVMAAPAFASSVDVTEAVAVVGGFVAAAMLLGIAYIKLSATKKGLGKLGG
ncbi:hypothetical protein [Vibrio sinaloensis]|uniref:hypothetical protein n=1 Tax=Photobacterium sp. (strain ATCC 43367) TaxID=379097 RepID=UPI00057D8A21|nr:hypothetical protein [Vibrio sinaloensis]KHT38047.1 hypothetical protein RJ46_18775 [Vibrio sinaloensis]